MSSGAVKDIYGYKRNPKPEGVFSSEESLLVFDSRDLANAIGYLVQSWSVGYQQQVQEIFEIGSSALYWMKGRPQGQGSIARIVGDRQADKSSRLFPDNAYDLCDGGALLRIKAASGACDQKVAPVSIVMDGCVVVNIGYSVQVSDSLINESVAFRFGAMEVA